MYKNSGQAGGLALTNDRQLPANKKRGRGGGKGGEMGREDGGGGGGLPLAAHLYTEWQMIIPAYLPKPAPDNIAFLGLP